MSKLAECHPDKPHLARGLCTSCYYRQPDQAERRRKTHARYVQKHPDVIKKQRAKHYKKHREAILAYNQAQRFKVLYGITIEQYNKMLEQQGGMCALCERKPKKYSLNVDHDHDTGRVRGLLCWSCNKYIMTKHMSVMMLGRLFKYMKATYDGRLL